MNLKVLKFNGVYDERTVRFLSEEGVKDFALDFRPRSLNFIQTHLACDIIKQFPLSYFYLQFENEKEFVVSNILNEVDDFVGKNHLILEFSGREDASYCDQFKRPFSVVIDHINHLTSDSLKGSYLNSVVLDGYFLKEIHEDGLLEKLLKTLFKTLGKRALDIPMFLQSDWGLDLFPSLCEYFDFQKVSYSINNKVEICFRNVDLVKVSKELLHVKYGV